MNQKVLDTLKTLGLNDKEIDVYLALLSIGTAPASILGNKTNMPRSTAQFISKELVKKGLFRSIKQRITFQYTAEAPEKLLILLDNEENKLKRKQESVNQIMGDLKNMMNPYANIPKVQYFEGVQGIISMFDDVLKENKTLYGAFQIGAKMHSEIFNYIQEKYLPKRKKLGNPAWMLVNDDPETIEYRKNDNLVNRVTLVLPKEKLPFDSCCHIYGEKVAFYSYDENDMTGILINNKLIFNTQFSLFKMSWKYALGLDINKGYDDKVLSI